MLFAIKGLKKPPLCIFEQPCLVHMGAERISVLIAYEWLEIQANVGYAFCRFRAVDIDHFGAHPLDRFPETGTKGIIGNDRLEARGAKGVGAGEIGRHQGLPAFRRSLGDLIFRAAAQTGAGS